MFIICEAMNWTHLPEAGGIYDQRPDLLDAFLYIWVEKGKEDRMDADRKSKKGKKPGRK